MIAMRNRNQTPQAMVGRPKKAPIKTSFMELLEELTRLTPDDTLVLATIKNIFTSYRVHFGRSLAPVRLVNGEISARKLRRAGLGRNSAAWA